MHLAVFLCIGVGIGVGANVGKIGLSNSDPIVFAVMRDVSASLVLTCWALLAEPRACWSRGVLLKTLMAGGCLFLSNVFFTLGVQASDAVVAAAWSSTTPVVTVGVALVLGFERPPLGKIAGTAVALAGALFFGLYGTESDASTGDAIKGSFCFLMANLAYATYGLVAGPLAAEVGTMSFTAAAFAVATAGLLAVHLALDSAPGYRDMICPPETCEAGWDFSFNELCALAYYVVVYSVLQFVTIAWARQRLTASTISAYSVVQPMASALLSVLLVLAGVAQRHPEWDVTLPGWNAMGGVGIVVGVLITTFYDEHCSEQQPTGPVLGPRAQPSSLVSPLLSLEP